MLDRISNRTAYAAFAVFLALSLVAAFLAPQEAQLGGWVRLTIWHGMLKWATIVGIFGMGVLAAAFLATKKRALFDWTHALQITLLPVWVFAVKPQVMRAVCEALAPLAQAQRPLIVSIAAGITAAQLDRWLGGGQAVVRAMPNTPALLGLGAASFMLYARRGRRPACPQALPLRPSLPCPCPSSTMLRWRG